MKIFSDSRVDKIVKRLSVKDSANIAKVVDLFEEYGFYLTEQHLKKLDKNLWELRGGRWRLLFGMVDEKAVIVDIFLKKSQKTPKIEINLALKRLKEYL